MKLELKLLQFMLSPRYFRDNEQLEQIQAINPWAFIIVKKWFYGIVCFNFGNKK